MKRPSASAAKSTGRKRPASSGPGSRAPIPAKVENFSVTVTKTIAAPVAAVFAAWKEPALRARWLPVSGLTLRKATPHKSIRIIWTDGTPLSINFWSKGALKCQVVPLHDNLGDAATVEKMKCFWADRLEALRLLLEKQA